MCVWVDRHLRRIPFIVRSRRMQAPQLTPFCLWGRGQGAGSRLYWQEALRSRSLLAVGVVGGGRLSALSGLRRFARSKQPTLSGSWAGHRSSLFWPRPSSEKTSEPGVGWRIGSLRGSWVLWRALLFSGAQGAEGDKCSRPSPGEGLICAGAAPWIQASRLPELALWRRPVRHEQNCPMNSSRGHHWGGPPLRGDLGAEAQAAGWLTPNLVGPRK